MPKKTTRQQGLSPLQRRAEFAKAVRLNNDTAMKVIERVFGLSYVHFRACMNDLRSPSRPVAQKIADYCDIALESFWGERVYREAPGRAKKKASASS